MEIITSSLKNIESLFSNYPFAQDFIIACSGVIFGGMVTVLINKGAIRKQAYFDLQYKILTELIEQVFDLEKSMEYVEIGLSFGDAKTEPFKNEIDALEHKALTLNEVFREKRSIVHKYLTSSLEKLIFPSVLFKLKRGLKKGKVCCGNIYGIWKVQRVELKKQKKVD